MALSLPPLKKVIFGGGCDREILTYISSLCSLRETVESGMKVNILNFILCNLFLSYIDDSAEFNLVNNALLSIFKMDAKGKTTYLFHLV